MTGQADAAILDACAAGAISPQVALARLLLGGNAPDGAELALIARDRSSPKLSALAELVAAQQDRLEALARLARSGLWPPEGDPVAGTAHLFDRLAAEAPEAGVAFYSLGDPNQLAAATRELAAVVRAWAPTAGRRVLDFGCGIGRLSLALAEDAAEVAGVDLSAGMIAEAKRRAGSRRNLRFLQNDAAALPAPDHSLDLIVAADSLPYVVLADAEDAMIAEAARVLSPGGDLLVFNWSYRGDADRDRADAEALAGRHGFILLRAGEQPFRIWDATGFHLRRAA